MMFGGYSIQTSGWRTIKLSGKDDPSCVVDCRLTKAVDTVPLNRGSMPKNYPMLTVDSRIGQRTG